MIVYINFDGIKISIFNSQIKTFIKNLNKKNKKIKLINFDKDIYNDEYKKNEFKISKHINNQVYSINKIKCKEIISSFVLYPYIKNLFKLINEKIYPTIGKSGSIILHCRGQIGSYIALKMIKKYNIENMKVIADFRGDIIEETKLIYNNQKSIFYQIISKFSVIKLRYIENYVINKSDYILCVSNFFKQYLTKKYRIPNLKIDVIPTFIDNKKFFLDDNIRNEKRKELNIDKKIVIVYSGAAQSWQKPNETIKTFVELKSKNENLFLLILSADKDQFIKIANKYKLKNTEFKIMKLKFDEVGKYLNCADFGILLRDDNLVNNVASPTKFAEYLSCGLSVITSPHIGDIDNYLNDFTNIGMYKNQALKCKLSEVLKGSDYKNKKLVVDTYYDLNKNMCKLEKIYSNLHNN